MSEEESAQLDALARDCLSECRRELMMSFRFLSVAFWHMPFAPEPGIPPLATDGKRLYFEPVGVVRAYRKSPALLTRSYLHAILHCVFRHPMEHRRVDPDAWSLASDLVVESIALEMCKDRYACEGDEHRRRVIEDLIARFGGFAPRLVVRQLDRSYEKAKDEHDHERVDAHGPLLSAQELMACERLFAFDSHRRWASKDLEFGAQQRDAQRRKSDEGPDSDSDDEGRSGEDEHLGELKTGAADAEEREEETPGEAGSSEQSPTGDAGETGEGKSPDASGESDEAGDSDTASPDARGAGGDTEGDREEPVPVPSAEEAGDPDEERGQWEDIAHEVEMELRSHEGLWSDEAGRLSAVLQVENRKKYDYADFLRRFSTMQEDMRVNDEEFDYIYYTYGLERFGNMPLVEPLEYKEERRIREFAIVIDTSGSCSGELVSRFIERTYDILKESESFFSQVNIHIVQCDARVQQDMKIEGLEQLERYLSQFRVFGFGGTDFRPAFDYVDELVAEGEFENLQGLVYFTDGQGIFPSKKPDYDTAFVFLSDTAARVRVPPWAMKVIMNEDEIFDL